MRHATLLSIWIVLVIWGLSSFCTGLAAAPPQNYQELKTQAEALYFQGSYGRANALYAQAIAMDLSNDDKRWVNFRIADTLWRSQAGTQTADSSIYDKARAQLEEVIRPTERAEDRDVIWAEAQQSLGDFFWTRRESL